MSELGHNLTGGQVEYVVRAFWRRIYPYRNDHGQELPKELPIEFRAHMDTALMWLKNKSQPPATAPIDMILYCPNCGKQHIDAPETREIFPGDSGPVEIADWTNPPHRSHLCHYCGCTWRPADVATNGVASIKTEGKADTWSQAERAKGVPVEQHLPFGFLSETVHRESGGVIDAKFHRRQQGRTELTGEGLAHVDLRVTKLYSEQPAAPAENNPGNMIKVMPFSVRFNPPTLMRSGTPIDLMEAMTLLNQQERLRTLSQRQAERIAELEAAGSSGLDEDVLEDAYWEFDARHKGYGKWAGIPQSERDAFKAVYRKQQTNKGGDES